MAAKSQPSADPLALGSPAGESRRERRKAETHERLLAAARGLFVERGYDATRPQDIARAADVATGTFYVHFADKRTAFLAFTDRAAAELDVAVGERARSVTGLEQRLRVSLEALCEYSDEHPGVLRAAFADDGVIGGDSADGRSLGERLAGRLAQELRRGVLRGELCDDFDIPLIAHAVVGLIQHALRYDTSDTLDRDSVIANVVRFCIRALEHPR